MRGRCSCWLLLLFLLSFARLPGHKGYEGRPHPAPDACKCAWRAGPCRRKENTPDHSIPSKQLEITESCVCVCVCVCGCDDAMLQPMRVYVASAFPVSSEDEKWTQDTEPSMRASAFRSHPSERKEQTPKRIARGARSFFTWQRRRLETAKRRRELLVAARAGGWSRATASNFVRKYNAHNAIQRWWVDGLVVVDSSSSYYRQTVVYRRPGPGQPGPRQRSSVPPARRNGGRTVPPAG